MIAIQGWGGDDDSMDDIDDDDYDEAADADVNGCHLAVPSVGITVTVSPPSPDCSPGRQPPHSDHLTVTGWSYHRLTVDCSRRYNVRQRMSAHFSQDHS